MKTAHITLILVLIVLAGIGYYLTGIPTITPKSTLIIAVKDAPKQSKYGTITSLSLTFSEVSVHKASAGEMVNTTTEEITATESNETEEVGWITVVDEIQTVDLLQFTDVSKILGQKTLDSGRYTQIRLKIDSGFVTIDGETHDLTIPSKVLKLNRGFELEPGIELKLILDFNVEKSLVKTGKDKYKLKPVIAVISEAVTTTSSTTTTTTGPTTTTTVEETTTTQVTTTPVTGEGILVMKIKDKLDLTNVTSVNIIIDKVEVHKAGIGDETPSNETFETNDTSSAGWETIVDETKSYNLLDLVDTPGEVMGEETLSAGKYTQIRLSVSKTELTLENITHNVKVPSKRFYWVHPFNIESGGTTTLTLDFDTSDSIKETGKNKFILKPVVKIISEISVTTTTSSTSSTTTIMNITTTIPPTTTLNATTTTTPVTTTLTTTLETTTTLTTSTVPENVTTTTIVS